LEPMACLRLESA